MYDRLDFYCIGDSHISVFSGTNEKQPIWPEKSNDKIPHLKTYKLGPVTAYNLCKFNTKSKGREKLLDIIKSIPSMSNIVLCFGEIDCRIHIPRVADYENKDYSVVVEDVVNRYFKVILELQSHPFNVFVLGTPPSKQTTTDHLSSYEWAAYGTDDQRNLVSKMFNDQLAKKCKNHNVHFIDIFDTYMNMEMSVRQKFFYDGIHLNTKALYSIIKKIANFMRNSVILSTTNNKTISVEVTDKCDMNCPHCIWINESRTQREMSVSKFKNLIQRAKSKNFDRIIIQGEGEIFMHSHFQELFDCTVNGPFRFTSMATNGLKLDRFLNVVKHIELTISFDGITPDKFYKHRGGSQTQFKKIMENIRKAVAVTNRCPININHVLTNNNYTEIPEIIKFCEDLGVDSVRFHEYHPMTNKSLLLKKTKIETRFFIDLFKTANYGILVKLNLLNQSDKFTCTQPSNVLLVGPEEELSPCCHIHTNKKYGVYGSPSSEFNSFINQFCSSTKRSQLPQECQLCSRVNIQKFKFTPKTNMWYCTNK